MKTMESSLKVYIVKHGTHWLLDGNKAKCPECNRTDWVHCISDGAHENPEEQVYKATFECKTCLCKFIVCKPLKEIQKKSIDTYA